MTKQHVRFLVEFDINIKDGFQLDKKDYGLKALGKDIKEFVSDAILIQSNGKNSAFGEDEVIPKNIRVTDISPIEDR